MDRIDRLAAIEEIKALKARYFRSIDTKDWPLLESTFAGNVELDYRNAADDEAGESTVPGPTREILRGNGAAVEMIRDGLENISTVHHGHMPEIEITGDASARAIWAMFDLLRFPAGGTIRDMTGYGHYHETYTREGGVWKIATLRLTRLRVDVTPSSR